MLPVRRVSPGVVAAAGCIATTLFAGGSTVGPGSASERIEFRAGEGVRLRKTFRRELELTTRSDGLALRAELGEFALGLEIDIGNWRDEQHVVLVDAYGPCVDQVPDSIVRTFERIDMRHSHDWSVPDTGWTGTSGTVERAGRGCLQGARVTFRRDPTETETPRGVHEAHYARTWAREEDATRSACARSGDDTTLEGLRAASDLTGLLPWRAVAVGDRWFTDVEAFDETCWPGGRLRFLDRQGEPLVVPVDQRLGQNLEGTFRVALGALESVDGVRYARLDLSGILESTARFDYEWTLSALGGTQTLRGPIGLALYASVSGTAWWNLEAGYMSSIDLTADVTVEQDLDGLSGEAGWGEWQLPASVLGTLRVWTGELRACAEFERI